MDKHPNYKSFRLWDGSGPTQSLDQKQLIPALISAIKEQNDNVQYLMSKISDLENRLNN